MDEKSLSPLFFVVRARGGGTITNDLCINVEEG